MTRGALVLTLLAFGAAQAPAPHWTPQASGVMARLRGVSAVSDRIAWASGARGTILRTEDSGATWLPRPVPDTTGLDFRDIDAVDARTAYALSIGNGEASRIYKTTDAGEHWDAQFLNKDPRVFLDAMIFADARHGVVIGDSIDGQFYLLATSDGGVTWTRATGLPAALPNEGAFSASGSNIAIAGSNVWIGTGAATQARVLRSNDRGRTWSVSATPLTSNASSGIFSVAFRDALHGVVVGGDYRQEKERSDNCALTSDGGVTWTLVTGPTGLSGYRSAVAFIPGPGATSLIAVGPAGADLSTDDGRTWGPFESAGFDAISLARTCATGWATGASGKIARLER